MAGPLVTPLFRLSFPTVFVPRAVIKGSDKKQFSIQMLFLDQGPFYPRDTNGALTAPGGMSQEDFEKLKADYAKDPTLSIRLRRLLVQACKEGWGEDTTKWPSPFNALDLATYVSEDGKKWPIRNGNFVSWSGFKGHFFAKAGAKEDRKPGVVDNMRNAITEPSKVFGGLLARAHVNAYTWSNEAGGKGVSFGLNHLQIIRDDGVRFGANAGPAEDAFGAWDDGSMDPSNYPAGGSVGAVPATDF